MKRLLSAIKTDFTVQVRNNLYVIGIMVALLVAGVLSYVATPERMFLLVPALLLTVIGGSTMMYVAGMILFEKDEHTINAIIVSPLRSAEYLWAKVISLTVLATIESVIMVGGAMLIMSYWYHLSLPNIPLLLLGIVAIGIIYTLIGIIAVVRYNKITDFLVPMTGVMIVLQLPFLYFIGMVHHNIFLLIPTSAPAMIMQGAYTSLSTWHWVYAIGYTLLTICLLAVWARHAFNAYIVCKGR